MKKLNKKALIIAMIVFVLIFPVIFMIFAKTSKEEKIKLTYDSADVIGADESVLNHSYVTKNAILDDVADLQTNTLMATDSAGEYISNEQSYAPEEYSYASEEYSGGSDTSETSDKMLKKTYTYEVETISYDAAIKSLEKQIDACGGYIENYNVRTRDKENNKQTETYTVRKAYYSIMIPADKAPNFVNQIDSDIIITYQDNSTEDVTEEYIDTKAQIASYEMEYKTLEALLPQATSVSETIEIQDRLSSLRATINSYNDSLEHLTRQVEYSRIYFTLNEVLYYVDTVERFTSDISEGWFEVFESYVTYILPMIYLLAITIIPLGIVYYFYKKKIEIMKQKIKQANPQEIHLKS